MSEPCQQRSRVAESPDGNRLVVVWEYKKKPYPNLELDRVHLTVANADGSKRETVTLLDRAKGDAIGWNSPLRLLGWFPTEPKAAVTK
jgi:hypothetical protein